MRVARINKIIYGFNIYVYEQIDWLNKLIELKFNYRIKLCL